MHRTAAQVHVHFVNTWKLLHPRMTFPRLALYRYSPQLGRCQRCSSTNFRSQTACNKPGNENRPIASFFFGTKHLPYGTGDKTKNSGTVPDVPGHLATMGSLIQTVAMHMTNLHRTVGNKAFHLFVHKIEGNCIHYVLQAHLIPTYVYYTVLQCICHGCMAVSSDLGCTTPKFIEREQTLALKARL